MKTNLTTEQQTAKTIKVNELAMKVGAAWAEMLMNGDAEDWSEVEARTRGEYEEWYRVNILGGPRSHTRYDAMRWDDTNQLKPRMTEMAAQHMGTIVPDDRIRRIWTDATTGDQEPVRVIRMAYDEDNGCVMAQVQSEATRITFITPAENLEMLRTPGPEPDDEDANDDKYRNMVTAAMGCPDCGNTDIDTLEWDADQAGRVTCQKCGAIYDPAQDC